MSSVTKPILLDETGQAIVSKLVDIKNAIQSESPAGEPVMITVVTPPTKTEYSVLETFDPTGIVVSAIFTNGLYYDITNECSYSPSTPLTFDDEEVTVSWTWHETGHTFITKQAITVGAVSWSTGSDAQIAASLQAHYDGVIDITDYWSVGDERTVHLSAMAATGVGETHVAQDVVLVLMDTDAKELVTPINTHNKCTFVVGQKGILENSENSPTWETGYMHSTNTSDISWDSCARRTWCNSVYKNALPNSLVGIFKQFKNVTGDGVSDDTITSQDYFALFAEKEIFGVNTYANSNAESDLKQIKYYETSTNIEKIALNGLGTYYHLRSRSTTGSAASFCRVAFDAADKANANANSGISPYGVI